jgi:acyl carrier protein
MLDSRLVQTVSRTFRLDPAAVSAETNTENTPSWDSVAHLTLILEIESTFGVRFSTEEIPSLTSVGLLHAALHRQNAV